MVRMSAMTDLPDRFPDIDYTRYTNRQLAAVPLAVLAVALAILAAWYVMNGTPVALGIEFTGGAEVQIQTSAPQSEVEQSLSGLNPTVQPVQVSQGTQEYIITTQQTEGVQQAIEGEGYEIASFSETSPSFGSDSVRLTLLGLGVAFVGMSLLIFLLFRSFVPSIAIVISAFSDLVIPLALMNLLGINLSLGTVAALLMLIGYSVDSDVLLNNHILRRRGEFYESAYRAMRTGVTMTLTSIAAMAVMSAAAFLLAIPLLPQIGLVLVMGLSADLMNTYMLNLSLLRWYKYEGVTR
ncbi:protein translocase subunit secF [Halorientalis regularis]|jgi:preprotein translocase subunit SecF|uniref:Protein-export membrane protein SecF n=2 Tax=Halorientalis regularis TaxID=660518 RepID=A0A1G7LA19_9EURY|nr:protein translocase subunit secF [Halorientalis regularis]